MTYLGPFRNSESSHCAVNVWRVHKSSYGCRLQIAPSWWKLLLISANWQPFIPPSRNFNAIDTGVSHVYQNAVKVSSVAVKSSWERHLYLSLQYQHSSHHRHDLQMNYWYLRQPKTHHPKQRYCRIAAVCRSINQTITISTSSILFITVSTSGVKIAPVSNTAQL